MPEIPDSTQRRLPAFIIGGAAKSGTSSLHALLGRLPNVFIPDPELYLFSMDDIEQHPEFFSSPSGGWVMRDFAANRDEYLDWYASFFADAPPDSLLGEDSTTYLPSRKAAERIRRELPDVKLIFMLRDPASRTYSQYWHDLRVGRIVESFEGTLRHAPGTLLARSLYRDQAQRYLDLFPRSQVKFLLFEELARDPVRILEDVTAFLGLSLPDPISVDDVHRNPARVPRNVGLQMWKNRLFRDRVRDRFQGHLPGTERPTGVRECVVRGRWVGWNLRRDRRPPPMRLATRQFLNQLFERENSGLSDLVGLDVSAHWYRDK